MEDNSKFWREIKTLVMLLASGAFVRFHKKFLAPSSEMFPGDHWVNWIHHGIHVFISVGIQIVLFLWLVRLMVTAWIAVGKAKKSRG